MNETPTGLIIVLSIIGIFALYWVLFGQWRYNKQMRQAEESKERSKDDEAQGRVRDVNKPVKRE